MPTYTRFDWSSGNKMNGRDVNAFNASSIPIVGIQLRAAQDVFSDPVPNVEWASVTSQYFCTILSVLDEKKGTSVWSSRFVVTGSPEGAPLYGIQGALGLPGFTVEPGKSVTQKFQSTPAPRKLRGWIALATTRRRC